MFGSLVAAGFGIVGPHRCRSASLLPGATIRDLLPTIKECEKQNRRLAGITPESYAVQRFGGLIAGLVIGAVLSVVMGRGPVGTVTQIALIGAYGWFLPMLGVRDTANKARQEIDHVIRMWIALVAQQVIADVDPAVAMLAAARMGKRNAWVLLHRFLFGVITLEWLLIVAATAGIAAISALAVQRIVDDTTEMPADPLVRAIDADIAAAPVAEQAQRAFDARSYLPGAFRDRCELDIGQQFSYVVDPNNTVWIDPDNDDPDNVIAARCTVTPRGDVGR